MQLMGEARRLATRTCEDTGGVEEKEVLTLAPARL